MFCRFIRSLNQLLLKNYPGIIQVSLNRLFLVIIFGYLIFQNSGGWYLGLSGFEGIIGRARFLGGTSLITKYEESMYFFVHFSSPYSSDSSSVLVLKFGMKAPVNLLKNIKVFVYNIINSFSRKVLGMKILGIEIL